MREDVCRKSKATTPDQVYQLKVTLWGSKPQVWRRVLVPEQATLHHLHRIIQGAMGWTNSHLHQFIVGREAGLPAGRLRWDVGL